MDLMYCEANASNLSNARGYNSTYKKIVIKKGGSIQDACYGMTIHWDVSQDYEGYGREAYANGNIVYTGDGEYQIDCGRMTINLSLSSLERGTVDLLIGGDFTFNGSSDTYTSQFYGVTSASAVLAWDKLPTPSMTFSALSVNYGSYGRLKKGNVVVSGATSNEIGYAPKSLLIEVTEVGTSNVYYLSLSANNTSCQIPAYPWNARYRVKSIYNGTHNCSYTYASASVGGTLGTSYTSGDLDSDWSAYVDNDGTLATPTIVASASPAKVSWNIVDGAMYIEVIKSDGTKSKLQTTTNPNYYAFSSSELSSGVSVTIKAYSPAYGGSERASDESNSIALSIVSPDAPTIKFSSVGVLSVVLPNHASSYDVYDGDSLLGNSSSSSYSFGTMSVGNHTITAKAKGNQDQSASDGKVTIYSGDSVASSSVTMTVSKLETPTMDYSNSVFSWGAVTNATEYRVYLSGALVQDSDATSYTATATSGSVAVTALGHSTYSDAISTLYIDSDPSNAIGFGTISNPVLSNSDNTLSWGMCENASSYSVFEDGSIIATTNETSFTIKEVEEGTHTFYVVANSISPTIEPSGHSNSVSIVWTRLEKPTIVSDIDGDNITVRGSYGVNCVIKLDINNRLMSFSADNSGEQKVSISSKNIKGENLVICRVFSTNPLVLPSPQSDRLCFMVDNNDTTYYKAWIAGSGYGVQLPISMLFTMDETLDTGSCILNIDDTATIKEPFETYQRLRLIAYNPDGSEKKRWDWLIEADKVTAKQYGESKKYLHEITLIELTKELQQIIMPDIAITQPLSLAGQLSEEASSDSFSSHLMWENSNGYSETPCYDESSRGLYDNHWRIEVGADANGNKYSNINTNGLLSKVAVGYNAILPDWNISGISTVHHRSWSVTGLVWHDYFSDKKTFHPHKYWYIRKRANSSVAKWTKEEALSAIKENSSAFIAILDDANPVSQKQFVFDDGYGAGIYDIYLYAEPLYDARLGRTLYDGEDQWLARSPNLVGMAGNTVFAHSSEFLVCFTTEISLAEDGNVSDQDPNAYTIGKALDKIVASVEPQRIIDGSLKNPKYSWNLLGHSNELCDEATWSGGRSLYEILQDVGRQFGGVPRLNSDYSITFDIMGETCVGNRSFSDQDNLTTGDSSMDNHASALVTQAKNIVSSDHWETYPYEGGWIAPRSSDDSSPYVTRSNCCIKLPHKIHQLYSIECKDMKHSGREYIVFIVGSTQMCLESAMWNLLTETEDGKGMCLCYTRGDDKILNLGALSPRSETETIFGLASDSYVIGNILKHLSGSTYASASDFDPNQLLFRVVYRPYVDEVIKAEQPDQSSERAHSVSAFNQDSNTVSDKRLGNVMENKASRLGNNSFQRMVRYDDANSSPEIGQTEVVDGDTYYADKINIIIDKTYCEATLSFTKNRSNIDPRVGVQSEYRQYEIYGDNYVFHQVTTDSYAIVSKTAYSNADTELSRKADFGMASAISGFFNSDSVKRPSDFYITFNDCELKDTYQSISVSHSIGGGKGVSITKMAKYGTAMIPTSVLTSHTIKATISQLRRIPFGGTSDVAMNYGVALHAEYKAIGNSVTFYCKALDNYSFGTSATQEETNADPNAIGGSGKYVVRDVRYVDDLGRVPEVNVALGTINDTRIVWNPSSWYFVLARDSFSPSVIGRRLPLSEYTLSPLSYMENYVMNAQYYIAKDNREALSFQYACHFISFDPDIRVRPALASHIYLPDKGNQGSIMLVYLSNDPMTKEALSSSDFAQINKGESYSEQNGNIVYLFPNSTARNGLSVTPTADYWGWAYVINDGHIRPMIVVKQAMTAGNTYAIPKLVITLSDSLPDWRDEN